MASSIPLHFERATEHDLQTVNILRADPWRGALQVDEFAERELRLQTHPCGRERLVTYVMKNDDGDVISAMDSVQVDLLIGAADGARTHPADFLLSVVTRADQRGNGFASRMIEKFYEHHGANLGILFSDIGPKFYEQFGFVATPMGVVSRVPGESSGHWLKMGAPLSQEEWIDCVRDTRLKWVKEKGIGACVPLPDDCFLDWRVERYRYYAEVVETAFPSNIYWSIEHKGNRTVICACPDFANSRLDCLWASSVDQTTTAFLAELAAKWKLKVYRLWVPGDDSRANEKECVMLRPVAPFTSLTPLDIQLCDWS